MTACFANVFRFLGFSYMLNESAEVWQRRYDLKINRHHRTSTCACLCVHLCVVLLYICSAVASRVADHTRYKCGIWTWRSASVRSNWSTLCNFCAHKLPSTAHWCRWLNPVVAERCKSSVCSTKSENNYGYSNKHDAIIVVHQRKVRWSRRFRPTDFTHQVLVWKVSAAVYCQHGTCQTTSHPWTGLPVLVFNAFDGDNEALKWPVSTCV